LDDASLPQTFQQNGISGGEHRGFQVLRHWTVGPPDPVSPGSLYPVRWE
jgi:hypothetical protein